MLNQIKLVGLVFTVVLAAIIGSFAAEAHHNYIAILFAMVAVAIGCYLGAVTSPRPTTAVDESFEAFAEELQEAITRAVRGEIRYANLRTIDEVINQLILAGKHMGADQGWQHAGHCISDSDFIAWYEEGRNHAKIANTIILAYHESRS